MYRRLDTLSQRLAYYGVPHQGIGPQMLLRLSPDTDPAALQILASVVQPPRDYARGSLKPSDAFSPLNRLVDAVPPESNTVREFNQIAARIATGKTNSGDWEKARQCLTLWRDNDAVLQPTLLKSDLTAELVPLSQNLSHAAVRRPHAIARNSDVPYLADAGNHGVLGWTGLPDFDRDADLVLGQKSFTAAQARSHRRSEHHRSRPLSHAGERPGHRAAIVTVTAQPIGRLAARTAISGTRIIPLQIGEQTLRIC
jgi:hypothetical protein